MSDDGAVALGMPPTEAESFRARLRASALTALDRADRMLANPTASGAAAALLIQASAVAFVVSERGSLGIDLSGQHGVGMDDA